MPRKMLIFKEKVKRKVKVRGMLQVIDIRSSIHS